MDARNLDEQMKLYFAHPIRTYGTKEEKEILKILKETGWEVVNPKDYSAEAAKLSTGYMSCKECKKQVMEPLFYRLIRECPYFLYWNPLGTCGAKCELALAKKLGKRIIEIEDEK
jgi:hypothetical protein